MKSLFVLVSILTLLSYSDTYAAPPQESEEKVVVVTFLWKGDIHFVTDLTQGGHLPSKVNYKIKPGLSLEIDENFYFKLWRQGQKRPLASGTAISCANNTSDVINTMYVTWYGSRPSEEIRRLLCPER